MRRTMFHLIKSQDSYTYIWKYIYIYKKLPGAEAMIRHFLTSKMLKKSEN